MKTNELMIGNWVIVDDKPVQVSSITKKKIGFHTDPSKPRLYYARDFEVKPILLNHELLLKIGFKQDSSRLFICPRTGFELFYIGGEYEACVNNAEYRISEPITFLHQLQNLYYSLERKQLKIEL